MTKKILFVDDEPMVLQGIQRSLRGMRGEWDAEFANSGAEALETMARSHFDVVITDMRMPGMDGAQLLEQVKMRFPRTVRMILSGQSDRESILRSVGPTHQYLSKPCDVEELKLKLKRAFALRDLLADPHLKEIVGRLASVPSLPATYTAITRALDSPDASINQIGEIILRDMGMSSKLLQLVNSAFFGLPSQISSAKQAAALIGVENIRALVLSVSMFSQFEGVLGGKLDFLWDHSLATAGFAKAICKAQAGSRKDVDDAYTAGILHDVGRLILASACAAEYQTVLGKASDGQTLAEAEQEVFNCTHDAVGAYLLGLWGLPEAVVGSAAWHHRPAASGIEHFAPLVAVHAANYFDHQIHPRPMPGEKPSLDRDFLARLGLQDRIPVWEKACQELSSEGKENAHD